MNKYLFLILLLSIFISGCARHNQINFSSSEAFFSSINETIINKKENKNNNNIPNNLKKSKVDRTDKEIIAKPFLLTLSSYEKHLKQKIGFNEFTVLKTFNNPSLIIKHGKIKNLQYHLTSCHLDLFFLTDGKTYKFRHFEIRSSTISSKLDKKKCVKDLNKKFILIHHPK